MELTADPAEIIQGQSTTLIWTSTNADTATIETQANVLFKGNRIYAFVDSANVIEETDETNNLNHGMTDCRFTPPVGGFNPTLEWEWTQSPVDLYSYQVAHTPAVGNLNDDNGDGRIDQGDTPDIIFVSHTGSNCETNGTLRAISGDGSGELFSITSPDTLPVCAPAVGDIDNDGLIEILVLEEYNDSAKRNARVLAFENNGVLKWKSEFFIIGRAIGHAVSITDLDADGDPEIVIGRNAVDSDGSTRWVGKGSSGNSHSIATDVDLDGLPEIVAGNTVYDGNGNSTSVQGCDIGATA